MGKNHPVFPLFVPQLGSLNIEAAYSNGGYVTVAMFKMTVILASLA